MKKALLLLLVALLAFVLAQPAGAANLVTNPGFETGTGSDASNWAEGVNHARTSARAKSGTYSLVSYNTGSTLIYSQQTFYVAAGTYYIAYWAYRENGTGTARVTFGNYYGSCNINTNAATLDQWQYVSGTCTIPTSYNGDVFVATDDLTEAVYFDDLCISTTEAECPASAPATETPTPTPTPTATSTPTMTSTPTVTTTPTSTPTPTYTPTVTLTPTATLDPGTNIIWVHADEYDTDLLDDMETYLLANSPSWEDGHYYGVSDVQITGTGVIVSVINLTGLVEPDLDWNIMDNANGILSLECTGTDPDWICNEYVPSTGGEPSGAEAGLVFPWRAGTSALYGVSGVHGEGSTWLPGSRAVDFVGNDNWGPDKMPPYAYAVASGTITWACHDDFSAGIVVDSGSLGEFMYLHLNRDDTSLAVGGTVTQGRPISSLTYGSFGNYIGGCGPCPGQDCRCGCASQQPTTYHLHFAAVPDGGYLYMGGCSLGISSENWLCGTTSYGINTFIPNGGPGGTLPGTNPDPVTGTTDGVSVGAGEHIWDGLVNAIVQMRRSNILEWIPNQDERVDYFLDRAEILLLYVINLFFTFFTMSLSSTVFITAFLLVLTIEFAYALAEMVLELAPLALDLLKVAKFFL